MTHSTYRKNGFKPFRLTWQRNYGGKNVFPDVPYNTIFRTPPLRYFYSLGSFFRSLTPTEMAGSVELTLSAW